MPPPVDIRLHEYWSHAVLPLPVVGQLAQVQPQVLERQTQLPYREQQKNARLPHDAVQMLAVLPADPAVVHWQAAGLEVVRQAA